MNPILKLKRRLLPPCSECEHFRYDAYLDSDKCVNPKGLFLYEKLTGNSNLEWLKTRRVRATKYCNFRCAIRSKKELAGELVIEDDN